MVIECAWFSDSGKFRLQIFIITNIGQFVHPVGGDGVKGANESIVILANYGFQFIR